MTGEELFDKIELTQGLDVVATSGEAAIVRHAESKAYYAVDHEALAFEWPELLAVLTGKRPAVCLDLMTRVVGYYSAVSNWNKSKLGELAARRKGNYGIA